MTSRLELAGPLSMFARADNTTNYFDSIIYLMLYCGKHHRCLPKIVDAFVSNDNDTPLQQTLSTIILSSPSHAFVKCAVPSRLHMRMRVVRASAYFQDKSPRVESASSQTDHDAVRVVVRWPECPAAASSS